MNQLARMEHVHVNAQNENETNQFNNPQISHSKWASIVFTYPVHVNVLTVLFVWISGWTSIE